MENCLFYEFYIYVVYEEKWINLWSLYVFLCENLLLSFQLKKLWNPWHLCYSKHLIGIFSQSSFTAEIIQFFWKIFFSSNILWFLQDLKSFFAKMFYVMTLKAAHNFFPTESSKVQLCKLKKLIRKLTLFCYHSEYVA